MDKSTSVLAAFEAGKIPSHQQIADFIDWFNGTIIPQASPGGSDQLSFQGRVLADDVREILDAYKQLGNNKNSDDLIQECLWHLSETDLSGTSTNLVNSKQASNDARKLSNAIRTVMTTLWAGISTESTSLFSDFASFSRLALADAAELVENQAAKAKDSLREVDKEVQEGERDAIGRKKRTEEEQEEDQDPKEVFARGMDTAKNAGVTVIGTSQDAKAAAERTANNASKKIRNAYYQVCDRAQNDKEYHDALVTIFDTVQKWMTKGLDTAQDINKSTSLESFIDDPTPAQHVPNALRGFGTILERVAGGKSLDDLYSKIRACVVDVRQDPDLQKWARQFFDHLKKSLDEPGYARSDEAKEKRKVLSKEWKKFQDDSNPAGKKWADDWEAFTAEWEQFIVRIEGDKHLQRLRAAHEKLGVDLQNGLVEVGKETGRVGAQVQSSMQAALEQASWFAQDIFKVYAPRMLEMLKDVPIPRTEYKDDEVEFVLENVELSSFKLNPAHIFIRNITDIDMSTTESSSKSSVGTLTRVHVQAMQLHLKDVSFWYKDKTASLGPSEFTGLMGFKLPEKGVDVDIAVRVIPDGPEREKAKAVFKLEHISCDIADDMELEVKQSNHSILLGMFKPVFTMRMKDVMEKTIEGWIRGSFEWVGAVGWDVGNRRTVFEDAGLGGSVAWTAAFWSELGKLQREGRSGSWNLTGTGVVREEGGDSNAKFAMGAEPQILSGEKRGPLGTASEPLKKRVEEAAGELAGDRMDVDTSVREDAERASEVARREAWKAKQSAEGLYEQGKERVKTLQDMVERKKRAEQRETGWRSAAFDISA
ncbi:hypothetical protein EYR40_006132 [Pleurotus pulmonarius]|nr:hypothetical protein EYR36_010755 [Pleurotus pulmonarius]KAF4599043.1 hypothetical protein EYR40_006132 [Pleurotus pulmonarius]